MDWDFLFNILAGLGSLATFFTFLFLLKKDRYKQSQIDKLSDIVEELEKVRTIDVQRLNLLVLPELVVANSISNGTDDYVDISIKNIGKTTKITRFNLISEDLRMDKITLPYFMDTETTNRYRLYTLGAKHINECIYEIEIYLEDILGNTYCATIKGKGYRVRKGTIETRLVESII